MRRVPAYLAILVLTGGCALGDVLADNGDPVDLQPDALVGTWQNSHRRTLGFLEDGTFVATDLPADPRKDVVSPDPSPGRLDGSGTWTLTPPAREGLSSGLTLSFDRLADKPTSVDGVELDVLSSDGVVYLYLSYQGGNTWTSYVKCTTDCP